MSMYCRLYSTTWMTCCNIWRQRRKCDHERWAWLLWWPFSRRTRLQISGLKTTQISASRHDVCLDWSKHHKRDIFQRQIFSYFWEVSLLQFLHYADQKSHTPEFRKLSTESRFCKLLYVFLCNMSNCVECTYSLGQRFHNCHF